MSRHLSYANVVSTLCLFLIIGSTAAVAVSGGALNGIGVLEAKSRVDVNLGDETSKSKLLYEDGTYKLRGTCSTNGLPAIRAVVILKTDRNHTSVDSDSDADPDVGPGDSMTVAESNTNPQPVPTYGRSAISATAPNGRQLTGIIGAGGNMSDADCAFNLALLG